MPARPAHVDSVPVSILFGQIPPWAACARTVNDRFKHLAVEDLRLKAFVTLGAGKRVFDMRPRLLFKAVQSIRGRNRHAKTLANQGAPFEWNCEHALANQAGSVMITAFCYRKRLYSSQTRLRCINQQISS
ncbi:MAG: hypothetical protein JWL59_4370 [Chthoniobacteraceae bacterium]|nr:hypothetical protein [Chthoniobacteraceae bacterium]